MTESSDTATSNSQGQSSNEAMDSSVETSGVLSMRTARARSSANSGPSRNQQRSYGSTIDETLDTDRLVSKQVIRSAAGLARRISAASDGSERNVFQIVRPTDSLEQDSTIGAPTFGLRSSQVESEDPNGAHLLDLPLLGYRPGGFIVNLQNRVGSQIDLTI